VSEETVSNSPRRHYPHLDAAVEAKNPSIVALMENTRAEIDRLSRTGTPREKDRARVALLAYGRALDLYYHLVELRDESLHTASNIRTGTTISQ
jgi:hypothetical protein